ncbi:MAG: pyruvate kinase [Brevinematia bacterium]
MLNEKFTKIVSTIGPSSSSEKIIKELIKEGTDVFRLNFSHGSHEDHQNSLNNIRAMALELNKPVAVFQDLQGPKIRINQLENKTLELNNGEEFIITTEELVGGIVEGKKIASIDYKNLHKEIFNGARILIDDGLIELRVKKIDGKKIFTEVINGGILKERKGVNLPHVKLKISSITEKDRNDLKFAFQNELEYIALSFVRNSNDVKELKEIMFKEYFKTIPVIAKIEKPEAILDIDNIIDVADAIMVARGDLGVETSPQEVPVLQKKIIRRCNLAGKPVITATQMLESMINNPRPTRAEATDVANAILDGTDAVMLSGETAMGKFPVEAVRIMKEIAKYVEESAIFKSVELKRNLTETELMEITKSDTEEATTFATIEVAEKICAKYITCFTNSGNTAKKIAKYRPLIPNIAFTPIPQTARRLSLVWGVTPIEIGVVQTVDELLEGASEILKFKNLVKENDFIVITAGVPVGVSGSTNMIKVVKI